MSEFTRVLCAIEQGDPHAAAQLLPLVYDELRRLAAQRMAQEAPGQTLEATALVHEAYLRLVAAPASAAPERAAAGEPQPAYWNSRGHFFAAAAEAMRRILVENARRKHSKKRGGDRQRLDLDHPNLAYDSPAQEITDLEDALEKLAAEAPDAAQLVRLRYFAGLTIEEAAEIAGIGRSTAYEHWAYARAWLRCQLQGEGEGDDRPAPA